MSRSIYHLSAHEKFHLQSYEAKEKTLRDIVRGVAMRHYAASYIAGRTGVGKTYIVEDEVGQSGRASTYRNARVTPAGLFELFDRHSDDVIILDDVASLLKEKQAQQILQGALDSRMARRVTRTIHGRDQSVLVTGGLIAISNLPLDDDPIAASIQSRVVSYEFNPTNDEIAAFMKHLVLMKRKGLYGLVREDCLCVVAFLVEEARQHAQWLDLRHLAKACGFYKQWRKGHAKNHWQDLVRVSIQQPLKNGPLSKQEEIARQRNLVRQMMSRYPGDVPRQIKESGLSKSTFYVRRREIEAEEQRKRRRGA
jgi:hypothetical protein